MAGAATASPLDAAGALMWNPATISGLANSQVSIGAALVLPTTKISSRIAAGSLSGGLPAMNLAGEDSSEPGVSAIPSIGFVERVENTRWSYGLGLFGIGGFRVNYPAGETNPILTPQPPLGVGVGRVFAEAELTQMAPTVSYVVNERLSLGFAPTITMASVAADPLLLAAPDDANGDSFATYPAGRGNRMHWGGGFQCGVYFIGEDDWHFGAAVKSPQWFEPVRFKTEDELGRPRIVNVEFTYPTIVTTGVAYSGLEDFVFATDLRFFDYGSAKGFGDTGFRDDGALSGLGWSSILAVSSGIQYQVHEGLYVRLGYSFNQNPISDFASGFNIASPVVIQHFSYAGFSCQLTSSTYLSISYIHGFENSVNGPIQTPLGPISGSDVTSSASLDAVAFGVNINY
jgi:long-chain fatty acid transport protein